MILVIGLSLIILCIFPIISLKLVRLYHPHAIYQIGIVHNTIDSCSKTRIYSDLPKSESNDGRFNYIYDDKDNEDLLNKMDDKSKSFHEYTKRGITRFQSGDLAGAITDMSNAIASNSSQPLQQRGILLYIAGDYEGAKDQLRGDITKFEKMQLYKASELRLWCSACYNKLGDHDAAIRVLDLDNDLCLPLQMQSSLVNNTLLLYGQRMPLEDVLEQIGSADEKDLYGLRYYGNFYLGLYFDSIGDLGLCQAFLSIPNDSDRYSKRDMWYHVPRFLYKQRFPTEEGSNENSHTKSRNDGNEGIDSNSDNVHRKNDASTGKEWYEKQSVNSAGMII